MCTDVLQRSSISLETKAPGIHVDHPRGASGLGQRKLVELEARVAAAGAGAAGRGCADAPPQRAERRSESRACAAASGRVTYHADKLARASWWEAAPQRGLRPRVSASSGAQGSAPNVHSTERCSRIRARVYGTNAQTYSRPPGGTAWSESPGHFSPEPAC